MKPLTPSETKIMETYNKASPADQLRVVAATNDQLFQLTSVKLGALPGISAIAATLLVVATFNQQLIPLNNFVRVLISLLIAIVPFSLFFYLYGMGKAQKTGQRLMEIFTGKDYTLKGFDRVSHGSPWIFLVLISVVMLCVLGVIWIHAGVRQHLVI